jgi:lipoic acid synthetase
LTHEPKPQWLKVRLPSGESYNRIKMLSEVLGLHTVCEEAHCPNIAECWGGGTATFMLMGDLCTRGCRFCAVKSGNPHGILDEFEPIKIAKAVKEMGLSYIVLTSVDRDDLPDGGAAHFAKTIKAVKEESRNILVEVLIPDFQGDGVALNKIIAARPDVISHNIETVRRLTPMVRDRRATYDQSLKVLRFCKNSDPSIYTKSSVMLGLGETDEEIIETMANLREVGVDILTLGQYLRPSSWHLEVKEYIEPAKFETFRREAERQGFLYVASGPLVRTSYRAGEFFIENVIRLKRDAQT